MTKFIPRPDCAAPDHVPFHLRYDADFSLSPHEIFPAREIGRSLADAPPLFFVSNMSSLVFPFGAWVPTRQSTILKILRSADIFSSDPGYLNMASLLGEQWTLPLIEQDPPDHRTSRKPLEQFFTSERSRARTEDMRTIVERLILPLVDRGECDMVLDVISPFAVQAFVQVLGIVDADWRQFQKWHHSMVRGPTQEASQQALADIKAYFMVAMRDANRQQRGGLMHQLAGCVDQHGWSLERAATGALLFFTAGFDTVAAELAFHLRCLAIDTALQDRLRREPQLISVAVREMVARFPIVNSFRQVTCDIELEDIALKSGDWVLASTLLAVADRNRDASYWEIDLDRPGKGDLAFGYGIHRCIGQHMARLEIEIALEACLRHLPEFQIASGQASPVMVGRNFTVDRLPVAWTN